MYVNRGTIPPLALTATALIAFLGLMSTLFLDTDRGTGALFVEDTDTVHVVGDTFPVAVRVRAEIPANVFAGTVVFDQTFLAVSNIEYNTSIADLWVEEPWYSQGDGTIRFGGGTTKSGGFVGEGELLRVYFTAQKPGTVSLTMREPRLLAHDGLGSDVTLTTPLDTIIHIGSSPTIPLVTPDTPVAITIASSFAPTDLNQDGAQTFADVSIFMRYLGTRDLRGDLNRDGRVTVADLSLLMSAR